LQRLGVMDKKLLGALVIGALLLLAVGLVWSFRQPANEKDALSETKVEVSRSGATQTALVKATAVDEILNDPKTFVVDVHTPEQTHIPGTDAFIPYDKISEATDQLPPDKNTPILVYCRSGSMSAWASEDLVELGYTKVYDLEGGVNAYKESHTEVALTPGEIELGTVVYGDVARTELTLTNYTPAALRVTKVTTSCSCTQAQVDKKTLEPYEATTVQVSFDPAVHKDDTDLGDLTRTIFIDTDNPNFPQVEADITAKVVKP
jgi:rhodanese-related sulfurtransferase